MSRSAADLLQELSALKQRTIEIERQLGLGPTDNSSTPSENSSRQLRGALKKALCEWHRSFNAVAMPMVVLDGEGRILRLNHAARELTGLPVEHLQFQRLVDLELPAPWPEVSCFLQTVLLDPTACSTQVRDPATGRTWGLSISLDDSEPVENARIILVLRDDSPLL